MLQRDQEFSERRGVCPELFEKDGISHVKNIITPAQNENRLVTLEQQILGSNTSKFVQGKHVERQKT